MRAFIKKLFAPKPRPGAHIADSYDIAIKLIAGGDTRSAIMILQGCIRLAPHEQNLYFTLGEAHRIAGETEEACKAYQNYLERDPDDHMGAGIKLFLLNRHAQPGAIPLEYVRKLFDQYAVRFEDVLVGKLNYATPTALAVAVKAYHPAPFNRILDLGCGTGLSGAPFKGTPIIEGVDISAAMLEKAKEKGVYTQLHQSEINAFLQNTQDKYDLIISADVLVYIGALEAFMKNIAQTLRPDGLFAFSVQKLNEGEIVLGADHRFWHSRPYVERCLNEANMTLVSSADTVLRMEQGDPVPGALYIGCLSGNAV